MRRSFLAACFVLAGLAPPAFAGADVAPPPESVTVTGQALRDNPDGKGDPDAVVCRKPQQLPGSHLMAPPVCKFNRDWAQIRKNGNDVSPDGRNIVESEKARSLNRAYCPPPTPPSADRAASATFFNPVCY